MAVQIAGLALLGVAFAGVRQEATVEGQQGWATLAVLAVIISGAGNGWTLLTARRAVAQRRHRLLGREFAAAGTAAAGPTNWLTAPGMTHYHRPGCPLLQGKATLPLQATGLDPCDWCRP